MQAATVLYEHAELQARIVTYLHDHTVLSLATTGPAGLWAAPVLYINDELSLYFTSVATTRHGVNMHATKRVVGTISDECHTFSEMKGVQLEGTVDLVEDLVERRHVLRAYVRKFPFSFGLWPGQTDPDIIALDPGIHRFYRITPTKLLFTDNEFAPGKREELVVE